MGAVDLSPKLWVPQAPAIIRPAPAEVLRLIREAKGTLRQQQRNGGIFLPPTILQAVTYATLDPTANANSPTYSNGNLRIAATSASGHATRSTVSKSSGTGYFEVTVVANGNAGYTCVGVCTSAQSLATPPTSLGAVPSGMWLWRNDSNRVSNGSSAAFGSNWATNDIIMVAFNMATSSIWWGRNGSWVSGDPAAGTGAIYTNLSGSIGACIVFMGNSGNPIVQANFGASAFSYTPPSGFNAGIYS